MLRKFQNQYQKNLFWTLFCEFINMNHELVLLANELDWEQWRMNFYLCIPKSAYPRNLFVFYFALTSNRLQKNEYKNGLLWIN